MQTSIWDPSTYLSSWIQFHSSASIFNKLRRSITEKRRECMMIHPLLLFISYQSIFYWYGKLNYDFQISTFIIYLFILINDRCCHKLFQMIMRYEYWFFAVYLCTLRYLIFCFCAPNSLRFPYSEKLANFSAFLLKRLVLDKNGVSFQCFALTNLFAICRHSFTNDDSTW